MVRLRVQTSTQRPSMPDTRHGDIVYPPTPEGQTVYVVGDIHGRSDLLTQVHDLIDRDKAADRPEHPIEIYLGDYVDRGPDSAGVIALLIRRSERNKTGYLRGNHEQLLLDFLDGKIGLEVWASVGATSTLLSYGIDAALLRRDVGPKVIRQALHEAMPPPHLEFLRQTRPYIRLGSYVLVHAGVRPGVELDRQDPQDLMTIRRTFLGFPGDLGYVVIHGHTPARAPEWRRNRINIDTGAFATNVLTCLKICADGPQVLVSSSIS